MMDMKIRIICLVLSVACTMMFAAAVAQESRDPDPAKKHLEYHLGDWETKTVILDPDGNELQTFEGMESCKYTIDGVVLELTTKVPDLDHISKAMLFYNATDKKILLLSVDQTGDYWFFSGDPGGGVLTSQPRKQEDGRELMLRFTRSNMADDSFETLLEYSTDNGGTWVQNYRQYSTRKQS